MGAFLAAGQRIERFLPLATALARIESAVAAAPPRKMALADAVGRVLAADLVLESMRPARPLAWRDGFAVRAEETLDAGAYAPALLSRAHAVELGAALPDDADAVAPPEAVKLRDGAAQAMSAIAPGDGVLPAGEDARAGEALRRAGERLRLLDCAVLRSLGVAHVGVREPRIRVVRARGAPDDFLDALAAWLAGAVSLAGGAAAVSEMSLDAAGLDGVLEAEAADALIVVGGTGAGGRDRSVEALARAGRVEAHGIALTPGETAAFGVAKERPVLVVPGRLDAAFAAWVTLGRRMLARLGGGGEEPAFTAKLARKIASNLGFVEIAVVRRCGDAVEPLASGRLPLSALAQADGWLAIPADSEGFPAGALVEVRPLP
jgi:molybdopterin biosynthesis enzyme